jgi:hypothetical protein
MVRVCTSGQMVVAIKDLGEITKLKAMDSIFGTMAEAIKGIGKTIKCMEREFTCGKMGEDMMVNMFLIKNKALGSTIGLMESHFKEYG